MNPVSRYTCIRAGLAPLPEKNAKYSVLFSSAHVLAHVLSQQHGCRLYTHSSHIHTHTCLSTLQSPRPLSRLQTLRPATSSRLTKSDFSNVARRISSTAALATERSHPPHVSAQQPAPLLLSCCRPLPRAQLLRSPMYWFSSLGMKLWSPLSHPLSEPGMKVSASCSAGKLVSAVK